MYKIVRKKELNDSVTLMEIEAPFVAKKAKAGQFIIFRIDEKSEGEGHRQHYFPEGWLLHQGPGRSE